MSFVSLEVCQESNKKIKSYFYKCLLPKFAPFLINGAYFQLIGGRALNFSYPELDMDCVIVCRDFESLKYMAHSIQNQSEILGLGKLLLQNSKELLWFSVYPFEDEWEGTKIGPLKMDIVFCLDKKFVEIQICFYNTIAKLFPSDEQKQIYINKIRNAKLEGRDEEYMQHKEWIKPFSETLNKQINLSF